MDMLQFFSSKDILKINSIDEFARLSIYLWTLKKKTNRKQELVHVFSTKSSCKSFGLGSQDLNAHH